MDIKVIYKNADGFDQEHSPSADSIQLLSLKTANKELTDTKLSHLIDGADAADEHIHDARYYRKNQAITSSAGISSASSPLITNASGKVDTTFIDVAVLNPILNHSQLLNLSADDHPQYLKTDGTRDVTGVMKYSTLVSITDPKSLTDKDYVDQAILIANLGQEWYDSAITRIITPPASPAAGNRYLIDSTLGTPTGLWAGHANQVATYTGSIYTYQTPTNGTFIAIDNENTVLYNYNGTAWVSKSFEVTTASTGLVKVGVDMQIDPNAAGLGLAFASGVFNVNVDSVGVEINNDILRLKALGVKAANIDFGLGGTQVSGVNVPLADAGAYYATKNVEAALQYLGDESVNKGVYFTAGSGGITKGQLVYISANDTVLPLTSLANNARCIGLALTAATSGSQVKVLTMNTVLKGVLSGASAGTTYYWTGSGYSATAPTTLTYNVWTVGVAKNATDLQCGVEFIKKNSLL